MKQLKSVMTLFLYPYHFTIAIYSNSTYVATVRDYTDPGHQDTSPTSGAVVDIPNLNEPLYQSSKLHFCSEETTTRYLYFGMNLPQGPSEAFWLGTVHVAPPAPAVIFVGGLGSTTETSYLGNLGNYSNFFFSPDVDPAAYNFQWVYWQNTDSLQDTFSAMIQTVDNDIEADAANGQSIVLMGASFGGDVAYQAALQSPDQIRDLILFDPVDENTVVTPKSSLTSGEVASSIDLHRDTNDDNGIPEPAATPGHPIGQAGYEIVPPGDGLSQVTFPNSADNMTNLLFDPVGTHPTGTMTPYFKYTVPTDNHAKYKNVLDDFTIQFVENAILGQPLFPGASP